MQINVIDRLDELQSLIPQWNDLTAHAFEENLNYEPVPLLSLLSEIEYPDWFAVCVLSEGKLLGFFPMQFQSSLPLGVIRFSSLFRNHILSCIPLIHKNHVTETLEAFWDWFNSGSKTKIFDFPDMLPNSPLACEYLLVGEKCSAGIVNTITTSRACGSFYEGDFNDYVNKQLSAKSRSSNRSKQRKLAEMGEWTTVFSSVLDEQFNERFSDLVSVEASGWKCAKGSAIAQNPNLERHMFNMAEYASNKNRFLLANAYVGATAVAAMYCIVNNYTLNIYKIGFDEKFKKYSVGQLLLLDLIQYVMGRPDIHRIDSCAVAESEMYNRCLPDQQTVKIYQIASNHVTSKLLLSGMSHKRAICQRLNFSLGS